MVIVWPILKGSSCHPSTTGVFLYTSGTIGSSKSCIVSHRYFVLQATSPIESIGLHDEEILYRPILLVDADTTSLTVIPAISLGATAAFRLGSVQASLEQYPRDKGNSVRLRGCNSGFDVQATPKTPRSRPHRPTCIGSSSAWFRCRYEKRFGHALYTLYGSVKASIPITKKGVMALDSCKTISPRYLLSDRKRSRRATSCRYGWLNSLQKRPSKCLLFGAISTIQNHLRRHHPTPGFTLET